MNYRTIAQFLGTVLLFLAFSQLLPLAVGIGTGEETGGAFAASAALAVAVGLVLRRFPPEEFSHRDAFAIVTFGWLAVAVFGALPFLFTGTFPLTFDGIVSAFFEAMSGVTTTGATVISDVTNRPSSIILWRSLLQWLGGMGFIVLSVAVLPKLGIGGMDLFRAEVPDPVPERLRPRIRETAMILWRTYIGLSILLFLLLRWAGMGTFDAWVHALSTLSTGGFSSRTGGISEIATPSIEWLLILFMFLAGMNYTLHFRALQARSIRPWWESLEFRVYLGIVTVCAALFAAARWIEGAGDGFATLRHALFHVTSVVTTTGFHTADFAQWPPFAATLIFLLLFSGAMAGSTSGSIKVLRHIILVKHVAREILRLIHPRAIRNVFVGDEALGERVISSVLGFVLLFLVLVGLGTLFMTTQGLDFTSAAAVVTASLTNVGLSPGSAGTAESWAAIPSAGKLCLALLMLIGRLEIFSVLVFLSPRTWTASRRRSEPKPVERPGVQRF